MMKHDGFYKRKSLPHYNEAERFQMITYRLADSLPTSVLTEIADKLKQLEHLKTPDELHQEEKKLMEEQLDRGHGSCLLKYPPIAKILSENFHYFDGQKYDLVAYTIMATHIHILIREHPDHELADVVCCWKSYTAKKILLFLESLFIDDSQSPEKSKLKALSHPLLEERKVWQEDFWDRCIRNERHFDYAFAYILANPVKAGIVKHWQEYPFTFAVNLQSFR